MPEAAVAATNGCLPELGGRRLGRVSRQMEGGFARQAKRSAGQPANSGRPTQPLVVVVTDPDSAMIHPDSDPGRASLGPNPPNQ